MKDLLDIDTIERNEFRLKTILQVVLLFHLIMTFLITSKPECICPEDELSFLYRTASN